jgi:TPR repeat protein
MKWMAAAAALVALAAGTASAQPKWVRDRIALEKACGEGDLAACAEAGVRLASGDNGPSGIREERPEAAVAFFERACVGGHMRGCRELGNLYAGGKGVTRNLRRAAMLYASACDAGDADGCFGAGTVAESGSPAESLDREPARAAALFARGVQLLADACDRGDGEACTHLGQMAFDGQFGQTKDAARALRLYDRGCEHGNSTGCYLAAHISAGTTAAGLVNRERTEAFLARHRALEMALCESGDVYACARITTSEATYKGCEHGDPAACFQLGFSYIPGRDDQPGDGDKAAHFYLKGCDQGEPSLCTEAAGLYMGVYDRAERQLLPPDPARAAALYSRACDGGDSEGCQRFAAMMADGVGGPRDPARASRIYDAACTDGVAGACVSLGRLLSRGDGVSASAVRAAQLFDRACTLGDVVGCYELGLRRRDGQGVARDPAIARRLLGEVCGSNPYYSDSALVGCREACALDVGSACAALARRAERGSREPDLQPRDVTPLYERAAARFDAECTEGAAQSCYALAMLARDERPLRRDMARYGRLLERACTLRLVRGCHALAQGYDWGSEPFPRDRTRAAELYLQACDLADADSCERAGRMLIAGDGLPADENRGKTLLSRAAELRKKRGY